MKITSETKAISNFGKRLLLAHSKVDLNIVLILVVLELLTMYFLTEITLASLLLRFIGFYHMVVTSKK